MAEVFPELKQMGPKKKKKNTTRNFGIQNSKYIFWSF
jgi:hypothetical protein